MRQRNKRVRLHQLMQGRQVLQAIQHVIVQCESSQATQPDAAVAQAMEELQALQQQVQSRWPLPQAVKEAIQLGPLSAKNIEDWNKPLAAILMQLDSSLQHDGVGIAKVLANDASKRYELQYASTGSLTRNVA